MQLILDNISKSYKNKKVLDSFTLTLTPGVYGLLGPNGAGKSTLIGIVTGLINADCGTVRFEGNGKPLCSTLGYLPQYQSFYRNYSAKEFLYYIMELKCFRCANPEKYIDGLLDKVNLSDCGKKKIGAFSGGMRQRLGIAQALLGDPDVLIFDEPTAGLDPKERIRFRNLISSLGGEKIVIFATHIVSDISYIAKEIVLLKEGVLTACGTQKEITDIISGKVWEIVCEHAKVVEIMNTMTVSNVSPLEDKCIVRVLSDKKPTDAADCVSPTLDDVCLYWFGEI